MRRARACLPVPGGAFRERGIEERGEVAQRDPALAIGCATVRFALNTLVHGDDISGPRPRNLDHLLDDNAAGAVERQQIGGADIPYR